MRTGMSKAIEDVRQVVQEWEAMTVAKAPDLPVVLYRDHEGLLNWCPEVHWVHRDEEVVMRTTAAQAYALKRINN